MSHKTSRRKFLETALKAGVFLPFSSTVLYSCISKSSEKSITEVNSSKKLKILILGGTSFLGPHQVAYAVNRGHSVSIFTRGKTKPSIYKDVFAKVEQLIGDRANDLKALENRKWDVVIDNSGRKVEWTKRSAALLKDNCDVYLYTSSTGVYYPYVNSAFKEDSKVVLSVPEDCKEEEKLEYDYGVMKANSELAAIEQFGKDRTIVVRPTYMIGPSDRTNRFIHWPVRLEKGGEIMVPGKKEDAVQYVDVRDVAEWMIRLAEEKKAGTYNAVGPKEAQNMHAFISEAKKTFPVESSLVMIDDYEFLKKNNIYYIVPWIMSSPSHIGSAKINNQKALRNGLSFRTLKDSIKDTLAWWKSDAVSEERRKEFMTDPKSILMREEAIIKKWKALKE
ncbi:MAG: NAD-dependent epimerase/dehydratase family protein [Kordia sp.]|uniref:NAD-dependent epimerase/dehydratase family protein n=1 Tax=Kordia sp. TaxID=1965332 RepID=UPI00385B4E11